MQININHTPKCSLIMNILAIEENTLYQTSDPPTSSTSSNEIFFFFFEKPNHGMKRLHNFPLLVSRFRPAWVQLDEI